MGKFGDKKDEACCQKKAALGENLPDINNYFEYIEVAKPQFEKNFQILESASEEELRAMANQPGMYNHIIVCIACKQALFSVCVHFSFYCDSGNWENAS